MDQIVERVTQTTVSAKIVFGVVSGVISAIMTYSGIDKEVFGLFSVLVVIDFATGIAKARTLKQSITSNKAKYGVISKFSLLLIPVVITIAAKAVGQDSNTFFVWGVNLLIISELYSVIGNIYTIRSGKELPEWDVIALIGSRIRKQFTGGGDE